jgi:3-deoxy-7-phosphoheptulonate synthase
MSAVAQQLEIPGTVEIAGHPVGGGTFAVIAGPCSVMALEPTLRVARQVNEAARRCSAAASASHAQGRPPSRDLEGQGLAILLDAKLRTDLPIVTEVLDVRDVDHGLPRATDDLRIGLGAKLLHLMRAADPKDVEPGPG